MSYSIKWHPQAFSFLDGLQKDITKNYPTNVQFFSSTSGLKKESIILLNQIRTIDKIRLIKKISSLDSYIMLKVDKALKVSLDLS